MLTFFKSASIPRMRGSDSEQKHFGMTGWLTFWTASVGEVKKGCAIVTFQQVRRCLPERRLANLVVILYFVGGFRGNLNLKR